MFRSLADYDCRRMPQLNSVSTANSTSPHSLSKVFSYTLHFDKHYALTTQLDNLILPNNHQESIKHTCWRKAFDVEIATSEANHTWDIVDLPTGMIPINSKALYRIKYKADGMVEKCKLCIVAKGYTQLKGVDYMETFIRLAKMSTI